MNKFLEVKSNFVKNAIEIGFQEKSYPIEYPSNIWNKTPKTIKEALKDNLVLAVTMHLPLVYNSPSVYYYSRQPILEPYFFQNFIKDIPSCTEIDGTNTDDIIRQFLQIEYQFQDHEILYPGDIPVYDPFRALISMSFGKDSLLTYAVANEIGLDPEMIYVVEQSLTYEEKHKKMLAQKFEQEFGKKLFILRHDTGKLRDYEYLGLPKSEFGWGLQSTEYALEYIPFAYALNTKYILIGNEQTAGETYMDSSGKWRIYPCYDQSLIWTVQIDQITQLFSNRQVRTGSLIEPLMDMIIQRILAHRYPDIAKYQMSCFTENEYGRDYHWCHHCNVCAKMYLLCAGGNIDPRKVGFLKNMLTLENKHFFTIFGGKSSFTYANTRAGRDEQLFAFYLAVKNNVEGPLVEYFKKSALFEEAKERKEELIKTFCSLYPTISLPRELKQKVESLYKEELYMFEF